jgi:hypothetical protein
MSAPSTIKYHGQLYRLAAAGFKWTQEKGTGSWPVFRCKMPKALLRVAKDSRVFGPNPWKWSLYQNGQRSDGSPADGPGLSSQQQAQDAAEAAYHKL